MELSQDAPQRPHVDGKAVAQAQNDFGSSVEARLDVRVDPMVLVATRAKIDNLQERMGRKRKRRET